MDSAPRQTYWSHEPPQPLLGVDRRVARLVAFGVAGLVVGTQGMAITFLLIMTSLQGPFGADAGLSFPASLIAPPLILVCGAALVGGAISLGVAFVIWLRRLPEMLLRLLLLFR